MIELLVKYIQDKGYDVRVEAGRLVISRTIEDQFLQLAWAISPIELRASYEEVLYAEADFKMDLIDNAIAERYSCPIGGSK